QAFLSKYFVSLGFEAHQASAVLTFYGLIVAVASWLSGILSVIFSPRKIMAFSFIIWFIFHIGYLSLGLVQHVSSMMLIIYGLIVAVASWLSGILAEIFSPRKIMAFAFIIWIIFHIGFLTLGLEQHSYPMMLIMYGIRGFAYPMFIYSFVVWITYSAPKHRL